MSNFNIDTFNHLLTTKYFGRKILYKQSTDSTMDDAREALNNSSIEDLHGSIFVSDEQIKGRGRGQKNWTSRHNAGIYTTFLMQHNNQPGNMLYMVSSLAIHDMIYELLDIETSIKWPNDIMYHGKKIVGILIENILNSTNSASLVGMGINLRDSDKLPFEFRDKSTDLEKISNKTLPGKEKFLSSLSINFEKRYYLSIRDSQKLFHDWKNRVSTIGKNIIAHTNAGALQGKVIDISSEGAMILINQEGRRTEILDASIEEIN